MLESLLSWFNSLSENMQKTVITILLAGTVVAIINGFVNLILKILEIFGSKKNKKIETKSNEKIKSLETETNRKIKELESNTSIQLKQMEQNAKINELELIDSLKKGELLQQTMTLRKESRRNMYNQFIKNYEDNYGEIFIKDESNKLKLSKESYFKHLGKPLSDRAIDLDGKVTEQVLKILKDIHHNHLSDEALVLEVENLFGLVSFYAKEND
ncbi:hypothetical protein PDQ36_29435 [Bacillus cereus]|nr:hypothetical protein [Bacillus cereus]